MPRIAIHSSKRKSVVEDFLNGSKDQTKLAAMHDISPRTVGRILREAGLETPRAKMHAEGNRYLKLARSAGLDFDQIHQLVHDHVHGKPEQKVLHFMANLPDDQYNALLARIIHLREAKKHNSSVTNAMLQLQNRTEHGHTK